MDEDLFVDRCNGVRFYSSRHINRLVKRKLLSKSAAEELKEKISKLVSYVIYSKRLPKEYHERANKVIVKVKRRKVRAKRAK